MPAQNSSWMKRLRWAILTSLILSGPARPCMPPPPRLYFSPNGRYYVASGYYGISFWEQRHQVWHHPLERGRDAAVSDKGDLILCQVRQRWAFYNFKGKNLATVGDAPLEFELDPPRTCWSSHGFYYVELSQGDIFVASQNRWQRTQNPDGIPAEVLQHQHAPVSDQTLASFIGEDKYREYRGRDYPNFRNLSPNQIARLLELLRKGNSRAGLALGLAKCLKARPDLLKNAFASGANPADDCQQALLLLEGHKAALELVPALKGWASPYLLRLYEQVHCPEAVPLLLSHLSDDTNSSHAALVAQTRVDLGYREVDWRDWLTARDKSRLAQFREPSAPLWMAQQEQSGLGQCLMQVPKMVARFDLAGEGTTEITLRGERLIRREGDAHNRVLEWSLKDGYALVTIPSGVPLNTNFCWNSSRQLLYYEESNCAGLWHGQVPVFSEEFCGTTGLYSYFKGSSRGKRPAWLPSRLSDVHFGIDERCVEGFYGGQDHRYSLSDSSHQVIRQRDYGLRSPDGRYRLYGSPFQLMDMKEGLIYRPEADLEEPCFSPNSRVLAAVVDKDICLFEAKNLRLIRKFPAPDGRIRHLALDEGSRHIAVATAEFVSVYELNPEPPDLACDNRLVAECWTGYRLWAGGARKLTESEYWQRRRRLAGSFPDPAIPYGPVAAGILGVSLLSILYVVLSRGSRLVADRRLVPDLQNSLRHGLQD